MSLVAPVHTRKLMAPNVDRRYLLLTGFIVHPLHTGSGPDQIQVFAELSLDIRLRTIERQKLMGVLLIGRVLLIGQGASIF